MNSDLIKDFQYFMDAHLSSGESAESFSSRVAESPHKDRFSKELFSFGPLDELFSNDSLTEILINGWENILIESPQGVVKSSEHFLSDWSFNRVLQKILDEAQVKVDLEAPFSSFAWRNFRVHMVLPPLSQSGTLLSMRRIQRTNSLHLNDLQELGSISSEQSQILKEGLNEKKNMLIVGGTSSGKTTLLSALIAALPKTDRLLILEDTNEIQAPNDLSAKLLTRELTPSLPAFSLGDLLKEALRMRPDRLVVGEVRGGEAKDLLMALSTGHEGSFATLHASKPQEALLRLEMLIQMGAPNWSIDSIRKLISLTIDWIVITHKEEGERKIEGVYEITSLESVGFLIQKLA